MHENQPNKAASSFLKGATILTVAGIVSRLLGLFYKIPLYHMVGSYGNGIYGNVTYIYNTLLMISTIGLPAAISKMVSESLAVKDYRGVRSILRISLITLTFFGSASSLFLFFGADWLIEITGWPTESYSAIMAIAAAPLIISVCSAFRGYFQGFQLMNPTAISQILEQIIRVGLGMALAGFCVYCGYGVGATVGGAIWGATIGGLAAMLFLIIAYLFFRSNRQELNAKLLSQQQTTMPWGWIFKRLLIIAIPVTLSASIISLFSTTDSLIYISRLAKAGFSGKTATIMFGDYTNVDTLIAVPMVIASNIAVALIPSISESYITRDLKTLKEKIDIATRVVTIVALPCCVGFFVLRQGIFDLLFPGSAYGPPLMAIFSFVLIFMMLSIIFQNILQSMDRLRIPLINLIIGSVIRLITSYILMAIPDINIYSVGISSLITFAFLTVSNYYFVKRYTGVKIQWGKTVLIPGLATIFMGLICWGCYTLFNALLGNAIGLITAIALSVVVYILLLFVTDSVNIEELCAIPGGRLLVPLYNKISPQRRKRKQK